MKRIEIQTGSHRVGAKAWLKSDRKQQSTSTGGAGMAAVNLAIKVFLGHNKFAQLDPKEIEKVKVKPTGNGSYTATYRE